MSPSILKLQDYIGRGIIMGISSDRKAILQLYILTARSVANQSRRIVRKEKTLRTVLLTTCSETTRGVVSDLVYTIAGDYRNHHVISNGVQTDLILDRLKLGGSEEELGELTRTAPPDEVVSPRISGIGSINEGHGVFRFASVLPSLDRSEPVINEFVIENCAPGRGFCITTYNENGNPPSVFDDDPFEVIIQGKPRQILDSYWKQMNQLFLISMGIKTVDLRNGAVSFLIRNRRVRS